jgi:ATP synthase protein I
MPYQRPIPDSNPRKKGSAIVYSMVQAEKLIQIALVLPSAVLIGWAGGAWLDSRFHQSWIAIVGLTLGSISGLLSAYRLALTAEKSSRRVDESQNENGKDTFTQNP